MTRNKFVKKIAVGFLTVPLITSAFQPSSALAAEKPQPKASPASAASPSNDSEAEQINVDKIKQKYWARGQDTELGVVQNRTYSKERKFELGLLGGFANSDPFLSVNTLGGTLGYHFSEYFALHLVGWKAAVSSSSALDTLQAGGKRANTNPPLSYVGAEGAASILYGKLSLIGKAIIYYDLHFLAGAGLTNTENGKYFTPSAGLGQNIYISKSISLRADYRFMYYKEDIKEKEITSRLGQTVGSRNSFTNSISVGISFLLGPI